MWIRPHHRKEEAKRKVSHSSRFSDLAKDFIEEKQFEWRNTKHRKQWASTLETYAYKILDSKPIEDIEVQDGNIDDLINLDGDGLENTDLFKTLSNSSEL